MFIDLGCDVNFKPAGYDYTALMMAAGRGYTDFVQMLIDTPGCDLNAVYQGSTAKGNALESKHISYAHLYTYSHAHMHAHTLHTLTYTCICARKHIQMYLYTNNTCTINTHTHTHTHTHTQMAIWMSSPFSRLLVPSKRTHTLTHTHTHMRACLVVFLLACFVSVFCVQCIVFLYVPYL